MSRTAVSGVIRGEPPKADGAASSALLAITLKLISISMAIGRWWQHCGCMPPSEGRHGVNGTVLLGHDNGQFGQSQFQLRGNLATLVWVAMVHLGAQFFDMLFE